MTRLSATDVRCVIFASRLQESDSPSADVVVAAVTSALTDLGLTGCIDRMAQEFGDHPEAACERMRWASQVSGGQQLATTAGLDLTS
jgi:hypothetical protein